MGKKQIEKEIIINLPHSSFNLKQSSDSKQSQPQSVLVDASISKLHNEQQWSLWLIKHRIYPSFYSYTTFYSLSLPIVMSIWYIFRGKVSKQNSILASYLTNKKWDKLFYGTVDL